jgi:hypothetical protein
MVPPCVDAILCRVVAVERMSVGSAVRQRAPPSNRDMAERAECREGMDWLADGGTFAAIREPPVHDGPGRKASGASLGV